MSDNLFKNYLQCCPFSLPSVCLLSSYIVIEFIFEDHNGIKSFDFPRFIVYMYFIMICIHCTSA